MLKSYAAEHTNITVQGNKKALSIIDRAFFICPNLVVYCFHRRKRGKAIRKTDISCYQRYTIMIGSFILYDYPFSTPLQNTLINEEKLS